MCCCVTGWAKQSYYIHKSPVCRQRGSGVAVRHTTGRWL